MLVKKTLAAFAMSLAMPLSALANEGAERLTHLLEPLETYEASFEQQILDADGERLQEAEGRMWLSRPGKFRWEVDAPYQQEVVSDGEEVILYDPDLEQVTVQALDQRVTHTPALLISGSANDLTESYQVSRQQQGSAETFTLMPTDADTLFEELKLTFRGEQLTTLQMTDSTGQRTAIEFREIRQNGDIDDERFSFEIPEGTDVIRDSQ
ncbi:outer membrane lipoprotein chaperone LolA [Halomonas urumqiensis]|uniref:Outer-membrane lipoprotein carrier protein n=1 Tax=Halomonas urumqiensis TaxID=1684789 RepID=A0A2N7UDZ1_9GAMM|nr:outer membrane lipoprotein chaperone LolA [Halomonas urumqiensis]PMR78605.1 outer membrane lipoprotein carrier protein LolA [Halomonas urumqiensis]PTB03749.1 outer membrane lipoprotein chaperone LolA [Halomonas urumqiensis]GHE20027.1 outer-membrane lipoprotein carrier protein [Halomonas urumqiensis]